MSGPARVDHDDLVEADRRYLWHPFTQQRDWEREEPVIVQRAEGTDLIDTKGRRYIDGVSSLWCNVHGHRHPRIDAAIRDQLDQVAHSTMLGLSHPGATELAVRLGLSGVPTLAESTEVPLAGNRISKGEPLFPRFDVAGNI